MEQTALPLIWPSRYDTDDYIVDKCNHHAFRAATLQDVWQSAVLLINSDKAGGKTHLARIFAGLPNVMTINDEYEATAYAAGEQLYGVVDDVDQKLLNHIIKQETLFHMINATKQRNGHLLLTATLPVAAWANLPDLTSRLNACQTVFIGHPEEQVVKAAFQKLFADRGLIVDEKAIDYLALRSERSFRHIAATVSILDHLALEKSRPITVPLIQSSGLFN